MHEQGYSRGTPHQCFGALFSTRGLDAEGSGPSVLLLALQTTQASCKQCEGTRAIHLHYRNADSSNIWDNVWNVAAGPESSTRPDALQGNKRHSDNSQKHFISHIPRVPSFFAAQAGTGSLPCFPAPTWTVRLCFVLSDKNQLLES